MSCFSTLSLKQQDFVQAGTSGSISASNISMLTLSNPAAPLFRFTDLKAASIIGIVILPVKECTFNFFMTFVLIYSQLIHHRTDRL